MSKLASRFDFRQLGKKRRKEIMWMALALGYVLLFVPFASYMIYNWNEKILGSQGSFHHLMNEEVGNMSVRLNDEIMVENTRLFLTDIYVSFWDSSYIQAEDHSDNVLWDTNINGTNPTNWDVVVINNPPPDAEEEIHALILITTYTIDDLLEQEIMKVKLNVKYDGYFYTEAAVIQLDEAGNLNLGYGETLDRSPVSSAEVGYEASWNAIDLLEDKVNWGGDSVLVFSINPRTSNNHTHHFETGDVVQFDFMVYDPPSTAVNSVTVLQVGAAVMGISSVLIGMVSTPWWNPTTKDGFIDRMLARFFTWGKGKINKNREARK